MSSDRAALRAAAPAPGAPGRAATPASHARAEASRKNGARSRGPKTSAGKARSAQNALKHGLRALGYVVLPDESALDFQALEAALLDELAPVGALQRLLATRVAIADEGPGSWLAKKNSRHCQTRTMAIPIAATTSATVPSRLIAATSEGRRRRPRTRVWREVGRAPP